MSRRVWFASACVLGAVISGAVLATPAHADGPTPTPTPTPTATGMPLPIAPTQTPTPSLTAVGAVTDLKAQVDTTGALVASWHPGAGDTGFTAVVTTSGRTKQVDTSATTASFSGLPAGAAVRITVTGHGDGTDATPVSTTFTMPAAVGGVTGAAMRSVAAGLRVSWHPASHVLAGTSYLVELVGADGSRRSRLVTGSSVTIAGLTRGRLYSATVATVTDTGRSAPVSVDGMVWTPPVTAAAGVLPQAAAPSAAAAAAPTATAMAQPAAVQPTTQHTLVASPLAAVGLAGLAVVLGGLAIGLLLRRPKDRPGLR